MCMQLECLIFASKNWVKLEHNYSFCDEFLEYGITTSLICGGDGYVYMLLISHYMERGIKH